MISYNTEREENTVAVFTKKVKKKLLAAVAIATAAYCLWNMEGKGC
jgi:hypothetical protein